MMALMCHQWATWECAGLWMLRGFPRYPARTFSAQWNGHTETLTRETEFTTMINYKLHSAPPYNHKYKGTIMRTIKTSKCNVFSYKNPRTRPYSIQTMRWHDRWRPHASQWPKPAYHWNWWTGISIGEDSEVMYYSM